MFNSKNWVKLIQKSYGYDYDYIVSNQQKIYYSIVCNDVGNYIVTPPFGDFIEFKSSNDCFEFLD